MITQSPDTIREKLLAFLANHPSESFKPMVIARRLSLKSDEEIAALRTVLNDLDESGEIHRAAGRRYGRASAPLSSGVTGTFRAIRQGQGIVETTGPGRLEKILIPSKFKKTAIDGDIVSVSVFARPADVDPATDALPEGEVVDVITRRTRSIIGTFEKGKNFFFVIPDSSRIGRDIYIPTEKTAGAQTGEKVAVKILSWESDHLNPEGEVVTVLGKAGEVHVEMKGIREEFQLPDSFPDPVLREADRITDAIPREEIARRLDLRELVAFTIDPADARDHDDALSIRELKDGRTEIGVHIADVSHYVTEGSALDAEALARGTSVYLPGTVVPMLPERLSADLCSLMPDTDRLAYSVMLTYSRDGLLEDYVIRKTVIHCREGFSYEDAQAIIDTGKGPCLKEVGALHRISRILLAARSREGSIDFAAPEVAFKFDEEGKPSEIVKKQRLDSHRLIEEFMLQANQVVAAHIGRTRKGTEARPFVYRVHDYPEPGKLRDFSAFVQHLGYQFNIKSGVTPQSYQKLLASVRGTNEENVINQLAIRSMAKAVYSDENLGHFGLAFKFYTHFTSPIRRYPDLIVHRLLHEYESRGAQARIEYWDGALHDICTHSSARERVATEAERASIKVMQVEYMKRHVGDVFPALVSGVTNFGLFVEISELLVEGMIRLRDLRDDFYVFDEKLHQLVGRRTKQVYRLGDKVTVRVVRVDPEERQMDFVIVDGEGNEVQGRSKDRRRTDAAPAAGKAAEHKSGSGRGRGRDDAKSGGGDRRSRGERKSGGGGGRPQGERKSGGGGGRPQGERKSGGGGGRPQGERKSGGGGGRPQGERKSGGGEARKDGKTKAGLSPEQKSGDQKGGEQRTVSPFRQRVKRGRR